MPPQDCKTRGSSPLGGIFPRPGVSPARPGVAEGGAGSGRSAGGVVKQPVEGGGRQLRLAGFEEADGDQVGAPARGSQRGTPVVPADVAVPASSTTAAAWRRSRWAIQASRMTWERASPGGGRGRPVAVALVDLLSRAVTMSPGIGRSRPGPPPVPGPRTAPRPSLGGAAGARSARETFPPAKAAGRNREELDKVGPVFGPQPVGHSWTPAVAAAMTWSALPGCSEPGAVEVGLAFAVELLHHSGRLPPAGVVQGAGLPGAGDGGGLSWISPSRTVARLAMAVASSVAAAIFPGRARVPGAPRVGGESWRGGW